MRHLLLLHSDNITVSPCQTLRDKGRLSGLWIVPLCPTHCLHTVLHQLVDSILVDHQGRMELSSLHQLFKTLTATDDTFRTDDFRWTAGPEQNLEFPFSPLPLPHRTPVVRFHIWLAGLCRPSGCGGERNEFREDRKGKQDETEWAILSWRHTRAVAKQLCPLGTAVLLLPLVIRVFKNEERASSFPNKTSDQSSDPEQTSSIRKETTDR